MGSLIGMVLGIVAYAMLSKKYKSQGIIYPANPNTRDQIISNPQFGHEIEVERLMQLLESRNIRTRVVNEFNLVDYYEIDSTQLDWKERLNSRFINDIQFDRTKYMSIVISAELKDPILASKVVNYIIDVADDFRKEMYNRNIKSELQYLKEKRDEQEIRFKAVRSKIYKLKDSTKTENIIENFLNLSAKEKFYESDFINSVAITDLLEDFKTQKHKFMQYDIDYQQAVEVAKRPVLKNYVVDRAIPSHKSVSPSILIVVLGFFMGAFLAFMLSWVLDKWNRLKAEVAGD